MKEEKSMVYTVKKLSEMSGVTVRTLHFYEEAGLLKPAYYGANGYRYYEEKELLQLQQILFFKELGFTVNNHRKRPIWRSPKRCLTVQGYLALAGSHHQS